MNNLNNKIKIFVACHKESETVPSDIITPIQVGTSLANKPLANMLHDNAGENISEKNKRYCELTAQYWAWKNEDLDYYGFFHYRRYLSFSDISYNADNYNNIYYDTVNGRHSAEFRLNDETINRIVPQYDIIVPTPLDLKQLSYKENTVYKHYNSGKYHKIDDYDFCCKYIENNYPEYTEALKEYNKSSKAYCLNMYVMKKELFFSYCEWLFPIIDAFDAQRDYYDANIYELRTPGFLAERLFGVWFTHLLKTRPELKVRYAQVSFIKNTDKIELFPAFEKNNIAVCLGADNKYTPFVGLVISSIVQNSTPDNNYDIIVFSNGITQINQEMLTSARAGYENVSVRFVDALSYMTSDLQERDHINRSTYLRFIIPKALKNYPKAVYIDCDVVVAHDIADLYNKELGDNYVAAVRDTVDATWVKNRSNNTLENITQYLGLTNPYDYFNAGVLLINIAKFNTLFPTETLFALAKSRKWEWQDQDILNYLCKGHVLFLEHNWNIMAHRQSSYAEMPEFTTPKWLYDNYMSARKNPYIVHYAGRFLPCFKPDVDLAWYFWKFARNCPTYELILNLQTSETVTTIHNRKRGFFGKFRYWFKKGLASLRKSGIKATWKKTTNKLSKYWGSRKGNKGEFKCQSKPKYAKLVQNVAFKLLKALDIICKNNNLQYWLYLNTLYAYINKKNNSEFNYQIRVGMLREDVIKLKTVLEKDSNIGFETEYSKQSVTYRIFPQNSKAVKLNIYSFDASSLTLEQVEQLRPKLREEFCINMTEYGLDKAVDEYVGALPVGNQTLVMGIENNLFGYANAFEYADILPTSIGKLSNIKVSLPAKPQKVVELHYMKWSKINITDVAPTLGKAEIKALKKFCGLKLQ